MFPETEKCRIEPRTLYTRTLLPSSCNFITGSLGTLDSGEWPGKGEDGRSGRNSLGPSVPVGVTGVVSLAGPSPTPPTRPQTRAQTSVSFVSLRLLSAPGFDQ